MKKEIDPYFMSRRTVRRYTGEDISFDTVKAMLEAASRAPTTGNMQLYSVIVTLEEDGKRALAPTHFNQPMVEGCAAVLTFCADTHRFEKWCEVSGTKAGFENIQSFMAAVMDCMAFAQQFVTIAEMAGYGTCYLGTTLYNCDAISDTLKLPPHVVPLITVTLGVPQAPGEDAGRLPVEAVVHKECYPVMDERMVKNLYAQKESRDDSKGFVKENNCHSLAEVFATVRYPRTVNEAFSDKLTAFLKERHLI